MHFVTYQKSCSLMVLLLSGLGQKIVVLFCLNTRKIYDIRYTIQTYKIYIGNVCHFKLVSRYCGESILTER